MVGLQRMGLAVASLGSYSVLDTVVALLGNYPVLDAVVALLGSCSVPDTVVPLLGSYPVLDIDAVHHRDDDGDVTWCQKTDRAGNGIELGLGKETRRGCSRSANISTIIRRLAQPCVGLQIIQDAQTFMLGHRVLASSPVLTTSHLPWTPPEPLTLPQPPAIITRSPT